MRQLGQTSLLIYWIHVEICYGFGTRPLQKQLSLPAARRWPSSLLCVAMLGLSMLKTRYATAPASARPARPLRPVSAPGEPGRARCRPIFRDRGGRAIDGEPAWCARALAALGPCRGPTARAGAGQGRGPDVDGLLRALRARAAIASGLVIAPARGSPRPDAAARPAPAGRRSPAAQRRAAGGRARPRAPSCRALAPPIGCWCCCRGAARRWRSLPAAGLTLEDKRRCHRRGGPRRRHHLRAEHRPQAPVGDQGRAAGRLRRRCPTRVLALSDVVGDDPATIASGPFSPTPPPSPMRSADRGSPGAAPPLAGRPRAHLARGAAGDAARDAQARRSPAGGDRATSVLAGPERVAGRGPRRWSRRRGLPAGRAGARHRGAGGGAGPGLRPSARRGARRRRARPRVLIGNGEPSIVRAGAPGPRRPRPPTWRCWWPGRSPGLAGVAFLAAGTDDRDGNSAARPARWSTARPGRGPSPRASIPRRRCAACDSARPAARRWAACVRGPGTSNLLDLHLLAWLRPVTTSPRNQWTLELGVAKFASFSAVDTLATCACLVSGSRRSRWPWLSCRWSSEPAARAEPRRRPLRGRARLRSAVPSRRRSAPCGAPAAACGPTGHPLAARQPAQRPGPGRAGRRPAGRRGAVQPRSADEPRPIASISKLAATLTVVERGLVLDELTTISRASTSTSPAAAPARGWSRA